MDTKRKLYIKEVTNEKLKKLTHARLTMDGKELFNPTPIAIQTGPGRPLSIQDQIKRILRVEVSRQMEEQGEETFDESIDFEVGDPFDYDDPITKYNLMVEDYIPSAEEVRQQMENRKNESNSTPKDTEVHLESPPSEQAKGDGEANGQQSG